MIGIRDGDVVDRYARSDFRRIPGLTYDGALALTRSVDDVQKARGIRGNVGEIGVFYGRFFLLLYLLRRPGERGFASDLFEYEDAAMLDRFKGHVQQWDDLQDLEIVRGDSTRLTADDLVRACGGPLRLLSIDGGHSADVVAHDLRTGRDALADGGVLILDDYFAEAYPGVSEATNRFFFSGEAGRLVPFAIGGNKVMLTHDSHAGAYRAALGKCSFPAAADEAELFGHTVRTFDFSPVNILGFNVSRGLVNSRAWRAIRDHSIGKWVRFRLRRSL